MPTLTLPTAYDYLKSDQWRNALAPGNVAWANSTDQGTSRGYKPFEVSLGGRTYSIAPSTGEQGQRTTSVSGLGDWGAISAENQNYLLAGLLDPRLQQITSPGYDPTKTENIFDDYLLDMFKRDPRSAIGALGMFNSRASYNAGSGDNQAFSGEYWKGLMGGMQGGASAEAAKNFGLDTAANKGVANWWTGYMTPDEQSKRDDPNRETEKLTDAVIPLALNAALVAAGLPPIAAGAASGGMGAALGGGDIGKGMLTGGALSYVGDKLFGGTGGSQNLDVGQQVAKDIADFGVDGAAKAWGVNAQDLATFADDTGALATLVGGASPGNLGGMVNATLPQTYPVTPPLEPTTAPTHGASRNVGDTQWVRDPMTGELIGISHSTPTDWSLNSSGGPQAYDWGFDIRGGGAGAGGLLSGIPGKIGDFVLSDPIRAGVLGIGGLMAYNQYQDQKEQQAKEEADTKAYLNRPVDQAVVNQYGNLPKGDAVRYQDNMNIPMQGSFSVGLPQGLLDERLKRMKQGLIG